MSAYLVFSRILVTDADEFATYSGPAMASLQDLDVRVLAAYGKQETLEGESNEGTVILEFPDVAAAKAWYTSPAYTAAKEIRLRSADYNCLLIQGV